MSSSEVVEEKWEDAGWSGSRSLISADIFIMYGIAFLLDLIGLLCFLMTLTVILAKPAIIIQWMTALIGKIIFTFWIVFFRHHRPGPIAVKGIRRAASSAAHKAKVGFRAIRRRHIRRRQEAAKSRPVSSTERDHQGSEPSSTDPDVSGYSYAPEQPTSYSPAERPQSQDATEDSYHPEETGYEYAEEAVPEQTEVAAKPQSSLLWRWAKRVLLPWIIESTPILGKIMFSWVLVVYLEDKNG